MNLKIGIVGLPNVGKSTLFNALTRSENAAAANFPFCTIDPNVGRVDVPDTRLKALADIVDPERVMPSTVEFVDIAGLVKGASEGEGLGNQFLSHIRECQAICHVLRAFESDDIHHVEGRVNPADDLETIMTELLLADLQSLDKQRLRVEKKAKAGDKDAKLTLEVMDKVKTCLEDQRLARTADLNEEEQALMKGFHLLTAKPYLLVANTTDDALADFDEAAFAESLGHWGQGTNVTAICAQVEADLAGLEEDEAAEYLAELGIETSGLEKLIQKSFALLGLQSYFTAGKKEVRSWTIPVGATAPQAAGAIHTDFEKGFIKANVISYADFVAHNGESGAKEAGKLRLEGKDYLVQDGDVMHFLFNV